MDHFRQHTFNRDLSQFVTLDVAIMALDRVPILSLRLADDCASLDFLTISCSPQVLLLLRWNDARLPISHLLRWLGGSTLDSIVVDNCRGDSFANIIRL